MDIIKQDLCQHIETMRHEICGIDLSLTQQAFRVDGSNSIKQIVGLNNRRSVDYFYDKNLTPNNPCVFIEFTDLAREKKDHLGLGKTVASNGSERETNQLRKLLKQHFRDGLVSKFKDSKDILNKLSEYYENIPNTFLMNDANTFYIVHAPIDDELENIDKIEISRYLSNLGAQVSGCLEDEICKRVKVVLLTQFINEIEV